MTPLWWSLLLATVGVFGLWLAGRKSWWGWAVGLFAQFLWVGYALATEQYGFLISAVAYAAVYAHNLRKWLANPAASSILDTHTHSNTGTAADEEIFACRICNPER